MALTEKLTAIADAIRAKTGGTEGLTLARMPDAIASISGVELEALGNPATAENIQMGYQAYGSDGNVMEGNRDFEGDIQSLTDEIASMSTENSSLSEQLNDAMNQLENRYQKGYDDGYSAGYTDGSGGVKPLSYTWDEPTLTLTVTEA